jgi:hypothetical protein
MTAHECLMKLRRRWYVLALVILCTLGGLWGIKARSITYQGCYALYLAAPPLSHFTNSYTDNNPSLAMTTAMVTNTLTSQPMRQKLQSDGAANDYQVLQTNTGSVQFPTYTQSTLQVCSSSSSPEAVLKTTRVVTQELRIVLHQMQAKLHVPTRSFITAVTLSKTFPLPVLGRSLQAYFGVVLLGLISGLALSLWSDPLLSRLDH